MRLLPIHDPSAVSGLGAHVGLPGFDAGLLTRDAPDAHWVLLDEHGLGAGRVSLWWRTPPPHAGHQLGIIGHYAAEGMEAGRQLLNHACAELRAKNCTLAVGPMDGNTWRSYRWVTDSRGEPPFFLEPNHPPEWPPHFTQSGFLPLAHYVSTSDEHLGASEDPQATRAAERMERLGVHLRPLDLTNFEAELRIIHRLVTISFQRGFLYQPLSEAGFVAQYQSLRAYVRPELVTLALHDGRLVGFSFALPDWLQAQAGKSIDTAIIKTLATLPERHYAGLGSYLVAATRRAARALGYRRVIHALMHESNQSRTIRADFTTVIRRYTLFAKLL